MKKCLRILSKVVLFICLCMIISCNAITTKKQIAMPFSAKDYKGKLYTEVEANFRDLGFENIESVGLQDIKLGIIAKENMVAEISIGMNKTFIKDELFEPDSKVVITYHSKKQKSNTNSLNEKQNKDSGKLIVPISSDKCELTIYSIVENSFRDAGFENVELTPIKNDYSAEINNLVDSVTINGVNKFKKGEKQDKGSKIRITYYDEFVAETESITNKENIDDKASYIEDKDQEDSGFEFIEIKDKQQIKGTWVQYNSEDDRMYMASIDNDTITVYIYFDEEQETIVYWTGTFDTNINIDERTTITSKNYKFITDDMVNASHNEEKQFIYEDSVISFNASYLRTNIDVEMIKYNEELPTIKLTGDRVPGFDSSTNNKITMCDMIIEFPAYFDNKEETSTYDYVEYFSSESSASSNFYVQDYLSEYIYDGENLQDYLLNSAYPNPNLTMLSVEEGSFNGIPGIKILYSNGFGLVLETRYLVDNSQRIAIIGLEFTYDDRTKNDYFTDFDLIIENIRKKDENI